MKIQDFRGEVPGRLKTYRIASWVAWALLPLSLVACGAAAGGGGPETNPVESPRELQDQLPDVGSTVATTETHPTVVASGAIANVDLLTTAPPHRIFPSDFFIVEGASEDAVTWAYAVTSSNTAVATVTFTDLGHVQWIDVTPASLFAGTATITVTATISPGESSASQTFTVTLSVPVPLEPTPPPARSTGRLCYVCDPWLGDAEYPVLVFSGAPGSEPYLLTAFPVADYDHTAPCRERLLQLPDGSQQWEVVWPRPFPPAVTRDSNGNVVTDANGNPTLFCSIDPDDFPVEY